MATKLMMMMMMMMVILLIMMLLLMMMLMLVIFYLHLRILIISKLIIIFLLRTYFFDFVLKTRCLVLRINHFFRLLITFIFVLLINSILLLLLMKSYWSVCFILNIIVTGCKKISFRTYWLWCLWINYLYLFTALLWLLKWITFLQL